MRKLDLLYISAQNKIKNLINEESGESNIIAIVIVLGIVVTLAITFGGKLTDLFNSWWDKIAM